MVKRQVAKLLLGTEIQDKFLIFVFMWAVSNTIFAGREEAGVPGENPRGAD